MTTLHLLIVFLASFLLTRMSISVAGSLGLEDTPNQRSSHTNPTPRGGGIAIVISVLSYFIFLHFSGWQTGQPHFVVFFIANLLVAMISFRDDFKHVPARWRLMVHFIAAIIFLGGIFYSNELMSTCGTTANRDIPCSLTSRVALNDHQ